MEVYAAKMISTMTDAGSVFLGGTSDSKEVDIPSWVNANAGSVSHHFGGSCYTTSDEVDDASRCADASFRVVGTQNIYISDASLMKEGTVNPYAFVMYIGHQAAKNVLDIAFGGGADTQVEGGSSTANSSTASNHFVGRASFCCIVILILIFLLD